MSELPVFSVCCGTTDGFADLAIASVDMPPSAYAGEKVPAKVKLRNVNLPDGDYQLTMTFGEHLDELRVALFRSVLGLVVGFLLGLLIATYVVHWITAPLQDALNEHYATVAEERLDKLYPEGLSTNSKPGSEATPSPPPAHSGGGAQ